MPRGEKEQKPNSGVLGFLVALYVVVFIGYLGLRRGVAVWYAGLIHPNAALPDWAFGPIWALLSLFLGFVAWRVGTAERSKARTAAFSLVFGVAVVHSVWTWLLFGMEKPIGALIGVGLLAIVALAAFFATQRTQQITALFLMPVLLWIAYAGFLNYQLWSLNYRGGNGVGHIETVIQNDPGVGSPARVEWPNHRKPQPHNSR